MGWFVGGLGCRWHAVFHPWRFSIADSSFGRPLFDLPVYGAGSSDWTIKKKGPRQLKSRRRAVLVRWLVRMSILMSRGVGAEPTTYATCDYVIHNLTSLPTGPQFGACVSKNLPIREFLSPIYGSPAGIGFKRHLIRGKENFGLLDLFRAHDSLIFGIFTQEVKQIFKTLLKTILRVGDHHVRLLKAFLCLLHVVCIFTVVLHLLHDGFILSCFVVIEVDLFVHPRRQTLL
mmetsp:Transcript_9037/g.16543  ORF Transcript_9037/g.16543 Transcript_9037/m.16543 type:complete len:231 (+) Transcript_9037:155-847(+)